MLYLLDSSLPFIGVPLVYFLLTAFSTSETINPLTGSVTTWSVSALLEEIIVVAIVLAAGCTIGHVEKSAKTERAPLGSIGRQRTEVIVPSRPQSCTVDEVGDSLPRGCCASVEQLTRDWSIERQWLARAHFFVDVV